MSDHISNEAVNPVSCVQCKHEFDMLFIFDKDNYCIDIKPRICPKCGCGTFHSKMHTDPNAWFGVYGVNE